MPVASVYAEMLVERNLRNIGEEKNAVILAHTNTRTQ
jgi:hypothetical protein